MEGKSGLSMLIEQFEYVQNFSFDNVTFPEGMLQYIMIFSSFSWFCVCIAEFFVLIIVSLFYLKDSKYYKRVFAASVYIGLSVISSFFGCCASIFVYPSDSSAYYSFHTICIFILFVALVYRHTITLNWKLSLVTFVWIVYFFLIRNWLSLHILIPIVLYLLFSHLYLLKYHFVNSLKFIIGGEIMILFAFSILDITQQFDACILFIILCISEIASFVSISDIAFMIYDYGRYIQKDNKKKN
ncbi:hypothetical protein KM1_263280 [Entamoeba histolytica HM-3:IMSS]|uniref:Uncharacterized protein n=5 Tax=Entamoeba histolytica TaxID=5759 RepID=C4LSU7_ENTH1|nr:hypothetical protein EHI_152620 [Entamoeba histolytica HM-1:IMSS]EMD49263.1 Hypothetical protein EHI5A_000660 [Entamoeba histolytica KU27]EMS11721.1 hypothetical protein KM1_263280 [Entamoeba histolytica HM-3:IMSS]ENY63739.1 hypothetical protein EHI7A_166210 [Entamoeba histolytica HM-1:IMSS-A]GAT91515.1 hypothetical protein CL6EHI_152620 [Entamoeba histolytica]EAL51567.1 hypothetical protein EHI_152620 [Entamoeba histolytica HM-1:IMSS]|eukprot:XP_656949.1 hypothetical protein EHI_152620 [Entamoeba histolytica HM-1:IMSS]